LDGKILKIAVVSGLRNAEELILKIKDGSVHYDFVEVMACPSGCVNGAGQPFGRTFERESRAKGLYAADKQTKIRHSDANPVIQPLYDGILKGKTHELLHVHYES
jgi:NADH-quinone oxidoreductase subunit G